MNAAVSGGSMVQANVSSVVLGEDEQRDRRERGEHREGAEQDPHRRQQRADAGRASGRWAEQGSRDLPR